MVFVNSLPYVSNPIEEFSDYKQVNWEREIYPRFKGGVKKEETDFFLDLIVSNRLRSIIDFGVGGGTELSGIIEGLNKRKYAIDSVEANEINEDFIRQASKIFESRNQRVVIHKANWLDLYPIYQNDMIKILRKDFTIEKVFHDFGEEKKQKSLFVQYLARRK